MSTKKLLLSILILLALVAAGCGDDDDGSAPGGDGTVTADAGDDDAASDDSASGDDDAASDDSAGSDDDAASDDSAGGDDDAASDDSAGSDDVVIDLGDGRTVSFPAGTVPNIGFFSASGNSFLNVFVAGLQDRVEELGGSVTFFDSPFDPQTQLSQLENALTSGEFNAWIVTPFDGNLLCNILTEDAPDAGILVAITILPACGRDFEAAGDALWSPGTLTMVNGENTVTYKIGWLREVFERLPENAKVAVLTGPELNGNTLTYEAALEVVGPDRPDIEIVSTLRTDFTTPDGQAKAENILQANQDLDAVLSLFSDVTRGVVQAIEESGRDGIEVYDIGANEYSIEQIQAGTITMTAPYDPRGSGELVVDAVFDAFAGESVERFIDTFPQTIGGTVSEPFIIDGDNAGDFVAQY